MKKKIILVIVIILILAGILLILRSPEDDWIKDSRGVWVRHGAPSSIPQEVQEQQKAVSCALELHQQKKQEGMNFSSQCLGTCENYAVDIVHVPRTDEDNLVENQCADYKNGEVSHFIELDKDGGIIRIV